MVLVYTLIGIMMLVVIFYPKESKPKSSATENVQHIEFLPKGVVVFKTRVPREELEIKPTPSKKGYLSFISFVD